MPNTPWLLAAPFLSIAVKRRSVERCYPGGIQQFEEDYTPNQNAKLYVIVCMSGGDVDRVLESLSSVGLIPGEDLALNDTVDGTVIECPGIVFEAHGPLEMLWTVHVDWNEPRRTKGDNTSFNRHHILIQYVAVDFLALGHDVSGGESHAIEVDTPTLARIKAGEEVAVDGQGFHDEEEGVIPDNWLFNSRGPGTAAFFLDRGDSAELEAFEAIAISFDGEQQQQPNGWFES